MRIRWSRSAGSHGAGRQSRITCMLREASDIESPHSTPAIRGAGTLHAPRQLKCPVKYLQDNRGVPDTLML